LGLSLLTPLALVLGLVGVLPLLAHLAKQTPRDRLPFGAMLLLERVVKRLRRRRRVKDLLLLLLRLLAVCAVVLASAGPRFSYPGGLPDVGGSGRVVLVVDRSMSMSLHDGGSTLLQRARQQGTELVRGLPEGTLMALVTFAGEPQRMTPALTTDKSRILAHLQEVKPSSGVSDLRGALLEARRLLGGEVGEVVLLSDEAGPRMVVDAGPEIERLVAAGSSIIPHVVRGDPPRNVAVVSARYGDGLEGGQVTVRVANYGEAAVEVACEVTLPDGARIPIFIDVPPAGEAEERITIPREAEGGVGSAVCDDPDLPADDARFFHLPRVGASRVLVVDGDPGDTPTRSEVYFLERALAPWGGLKTGVTIDVTTPVGLMELDPEQHRVVFLANVADPRPFGPRLTEFVRRGGNLVISGGDNVTAGRYNASLGGVLPTPIRKPRSVADPGELGVPLALPSTEHPLFSPFSRAGRQGFERVRTHTLLTFEPYEDVPEQVTTLLRYDNGMPALIERRIGNGRVLVWASTLDLGWGNLPLQAAFMPLVQRLVAYLGGDAGGHALRLDALVGEQVVVQLPDLVMQPDVRGPDGSAVRSRIDGSRLLFVPEQAGAYAVELESAPELAWLAVNTDPIESDVRPYDSVATVERELDPDLLLQHADLGRGLLGLALALMLGSSLIAGLGRKP